MLRNSKVDHYSMEVTESLQELYNLCKVSQSDSGNLLLCQQNGFIWQGSPCIGIGEEGLNNMHKINSLSYNGIGVLTDDDECFSKKGISFMSGIEELPQTVNKEFTNYLNIWENNSFIRTFTQVINVLNGEHYDWYLDISKLSAPQKSKHIRERIVQKLSLAPKLYNIMKQAYIGQLRNAAAHTDYHCIQGGIWLDNYQKDKYANIQAVSFEEWEKIYSYSYLVFIGLYGLLKQVTTEFYLPLTKVTLSGGVPILIPNNNGWQLTSVYPNSDGSTWRFTKIPSKAK